jgi:hypothetical protein
MRRVFGIEIVSLAAFLVTASACVNQQQQVPEMAQAQQLAGQRIDQAANWTQQLCAELGQGPGTPYFSRCYNDRFAYSEDQEAANRTRQLCTELRQGPGTPYFARCYEDRFGEAQR